MKKLFLFITALFVVASASAQNSQPMSWNWVQGTGGPATSFLVERATVAGGPYAVICGGASQPTCPTATTLTYTDFTVVAGTTYFYVVAASGPGGVSGFSNELKAVIPFLPPSSPTGLH